MLSKPNSTTGMKCPFSVSPTSVNLNWTSLKSFYNYKKVGRKLWTVQCHYLMGSFMSLHSPSFSYISQQCLRYGVPCGVEGEKKKNVWREEGEARSMTKAYSGRALESFRVPVSASSFGQADRKEKRRLLGTRQTREEEEKADSQTWREQRNGEKERRWKRERVALILVQRVEFNIEFHRWTTHSQNVF